LLDAVAHRLAPRLGPEDADAQLREVDLHLLRRLGQMQEVARRAADRRDSEILDDHQLALGIAAADRDHRRAQGLGTVMRTEAAGEEAVAVRVLDDIAAMHATGGKGSNHHFGPDVQVGLGVGDDDRLAGGTR
jgi:hypothetical protein